MVSFSFVSAATVLLATLSQATPVKKVGQKKQQAAAGDWQHSASWDFTTLNALPSDLLISTDHIGAPPAGKAQQYTKDAVYVENGAINLKVGGGQAGKDTIQGAQLYTSFKMLYGSVRTTARISKAGGTCSGFFTYNGQNLEETDIELLGSNLTAVHYTNQRPNYVSGSGSGSGSYTRTGPVPEDATSAFHEYRLDWTQGSVKFYLDGALQTDLTTFVPTQPTVFLWNNWSNANEGWSAGPPTSDNVLEIQKIEMYYNTA